MSPVRLAVIGVGSMGIRHVNLIRAYDKSTLVGICDVDPNKKSVADALGVPFFNSPEELIETVQPAGAIIATSNSYHAAVAEICAERSVHVLIEKPLADTIPQAMRIVETSDKHAVRVLVGHHRRHSPYIQKVRELVRSGVLGDLVCVSLLWTLMKPPEYFDVQWRHKQQVGGPLLINLIHEIDTLRFVCGEIRDVFARTSSSVRNFDVEDSLSISIAFENGTLGTIVASDATPAPWSYEATVPENPLYFHTDENCYYFLGSRASLAFPGMELWRYPNANRVGWQHPMEKVPVHVESADPLEIQLAHFCAVIRGEDHPLIDASDGARSLAAAVAVHESARQQISIAPLSIMSQH